MFTDFLRYSDDRLDTSTDSWSHSGKSTHSTTQHGAGHKATSLTTTTDTTTGSAATALFLTEPGETAAISYQDINQGQVGDCFLLSPLGELAMNDPAMIQQMIHDNGNGTQTVTLYDDAQGGPVTLQTTSFAKTQVTVNDSFYASGANNGATQDVVNGVKEIWVQVVEKAFAALESTNPATLASVDSGSSLAPIANGGLAFLAMESLTGNTAYCYIPSTVGVSYLQGAAASHDLICFDTLANPEPGYGLVADHSYMFDHIVGSGSSAAVALDNPWGFDNPTSAIPFSQFANTFVQVDVGKA